MLPTFDFQICTNETAVPHLVVGVWAVCRMSFQPAASRTHTLLPFIDVQELVDVELTNKCRQPALRSDRGSVEK